MAAPERGDWRVENCSAESQVRRVGGEERHCLPVEQCGIEESTSRVGARLGRIISRFPEARLASISHISGIDRCARGSAADARL